MSRTYYNARNVEACATHLLRWTPFAHPPSSSAIAKNQLLHDPEPADSPPLPPGQGIANKPAEAEAEEEEEEEVVKIENPPCLPDLGGTHSSGWSKRQKQLSRALARGLWRWKEGFHARKRRRRSSLNVSRSGSSRSSDAKASHSFIFVSDPSASDFLLRPDSSGELFFLHSSSGDFLGPPSTTTTTTTTTSTATFPPFPPFTPLDSELRHALDCLSLNKHQHLATMDSCTCSDVLSVDSGYGSEPGYCGDGEIGYGDDALTDELDEEDTREVLRKFWKDAAPFIKDALPDALLLSRSLKDQKGMHQRLRRRRRHDLRRGGVQWTKHLS